MNILLALDSKSNQEITHFLSQFQKDTYTCVTDGESAINFIINQRPDIILLDLILPKKDGFAVLDFVNSKLLGKKPLIIIISALIDNNFIKKALMLGVAEYMIKPINLNILKFHIDKFKSSTNNHNIKNNQTNHIEEYVSNLLISIGVPPQLNGYAYLRKAIILAIENQEYIKNVTKKLYPEIAKIFGTTASKVERAIRNAIEIAWNSDKYENINTIFGYKVYGGNYKPTNTELVALISDRIALVYNY